MRKSLAKLALTLTCVLSLTGTASAELFVSGLMTLVARNADVNNAHNHTNLGYSAFDAVSARLFLDARVTDRLSGFVQLYTSRDYDPILYGAYIRYDHTANEHVEAGIIPVPVGLWGPRTYADKNPLVAVPLIYQYKTSMQTFGGVQTTAEEILEDRGEAEYSPQLYDFCWNAGVHGYASVGPFDIGAALQAGSLGSPSREVKYDYPNVTGNVNWVPGPWLTIGVWGATGPFLPTSVEVMLPAGKKVEDYHQQTMGALLHAAHGHGELYAEGIVNRFDHPFLGDLNSQGGYIDAEYAFLTQWYAAVRVEALGFNRLAPAIDPDENRWDFPLSRYEAGIGYRSSPRTVVKLVTQIVRYTGAPSSLDDEIYGLQFVVKL